MSEAQNIGIEALLWREESFTYAGTKLFLPPGRWINFVELSDAESPEWEFFCGTFLSDSYAEAPNHHNSEDGYFGTVTKLWDEIMDVDE